MASALEIIVRARTVQLSFAARAALNELACRLTGTQDEAESADVFRWLELIGFSYGHARRVLAELRSSGLLAYRRDYQRVLYTVDATASAGGTPRSSASAVPPSTASAGERGATYKTSDQKKTSILPSAATPSPSNRSTKVEHLTIHGTTASKTDIHAISRLLAQQQRLNPDDLLRTAADEQLIVRCMSRTENAWTEESLSAWMTHCERINVRVLRWAFILGPTAWILEARERWFEDNAPTVVDETPAISRREQARLSAIAADAAWKKEREERLAARALRKAAK